jgi:hypothetical protein
LIPAAARNAAIAVNTVNWRSIPQNGGLSQFLKMVA